MRNYSKMSDQERTDILKKHSEVYDGYAVGNVSSNMTPLTVYDAAGDKNGITINNEGNITEYKNHNVNELSTDPLNYDEIDPAYDFDSQGPTDVYENEPAYNDVNLYDLECSGVENNKSEVKETVNTSLDMFRRFKKFN
jgi:hypothetical protein